MRLGFVRLLSVGISTGIRDSCNNRVGLLQDVRVSIKRWHQWAEFSRELLHHELPPYANLICSQTENIRWETGGSTLLGPTMAHRLLLFKGSSYQMSPCPQSTEGKREQVSSHHCADKESEAQGGWGTCPGRRSAQLSGLQPRAPHPSLTLYHWSGRQAPS